MAALAAALAALKSAKEKHASMLQDEGTLPRRSRPPPPLIPPRLKRVLCVLGHGEALWTEIAGQNGVLMPTYTFISVHMR